MQSIASNFPQAIPGKRADAFSVDLSISDYHAVSDRISHSGMCVLMRSPAHYMAYLQQKDDGGERKVNFGSAVHSALLEPHKFATEYAVFDGTRRGKAYDEFKAANPGALILNLDESQRIAGIVEAMRSFKDFPIYDALRIGESEKSIFWTDEETGAPCRMRADTLNPFAIFDLKTIDDARPEKVAAQIMRMDYDLQAYMYRSGAQAFTGDLLPFNFIFIEDKEPHGIWLYTAGASLLESGREKFIRGAKAFMDLPQADLTQAYANAFAVIEAPRWRQKELANRKMSDQEIWLAKPTEGEVSLI